MTYWAYINQQNNLIVEPYNEYYSHLIFENKIIKERTGEYEADNEQEAREKAMSILNYDENLVSEIIDNQIDDLKN